jgi:gamma-polyglutamate biosynthesis protein CapA
MNPRILFTFLVFVLVIQIASLNPRLFFLSEHSVGELSEITEQVGFFAQKVFTEATLTSARNFVEYDSVVFVGDVMLGRHVETLLDRHGSGYVYAGYPLKLFSQNSAVVANFESAMMLPHVQTPALSMRFSAKEEYVNGFAEEFSHASLANNHSLDYDEEGYVNTVAALQSNSVSVFGHNSRIDKNSISYLKTARGTISLIGINATARTPEVEEINSVCTEAKKQSDFQIVSIHWGDEYELTHNETQRALAEILVDTCADLIIGHHPHVVQDIDIIKGVPVFYSLGNYIFDQYFSSDVMRGMVVALTLEESPALELVPVSSEAIRSVPEPMNSETKAIFLENLAERSHASLYSSIIGGKINLFEPVATSTKMAIMSR